MHVLIRKSAWASLHLDMLAAIWKEELWVINDAKLDLDKCSN
jgi:hypothetical protein